MAGEQQVRIAQEHDIVIARQTARELARVLGFGSIDQSRIATAVSELTRNVIRYATDGQGRVSLRPVERDGRSGLEIVVADEGPGIADIDLVMTEGYTSGEGLGLGLSGTKRLMDEMELESTVGEGTTITIRKWRR
ncbi:MAG: anti-sigma regulatory factor [Dehalococcoidia bacterium]